MLSFIDYLPDATLAIDLEGRVVAWNQLWRLTGIKASEMLGKGEYEYGLAFYNSRRRLWWTRTQPDEVKKFYSVIEKDNLTIISEFDTLTCVAKDIIYGVRPSAGLIRKEICWELLNH